ncbi:MAG: sigma-54-dependent Fis family transcriptional regulator [Gammaproteobacteria bacterium]|nr:sigma-54-dependent Fis family transcriptional regulator [Gammaproteobacteria bacterium]
MNSQNPSLLGNAPEFLSLLRSAKVIAATDVTTLLLGESGTGKELVATHMHQHSHRAIAPLVSINCAALPESLAESELFGHAAGAFTGANQSYDGRIAAAAGGTLFLDEIGELPLTVQAKLLRFIEAGECQRLGETRPRKVDVRIIAATHVDLFARVQEQRFRQDLFYRLNIVPLELPPLRQRNGDLALLLKAFTTQLTAQYQLPAPRYSPDTLKRLEQHNWPGNVRELRNFCERMVILFSGREVAPENLPRELQQPPIHQHYFDLPQEGVRLEELEQSLINKALSRSGGNRSQAARLLGITRDTLLYRIKKYALGESEAKLESRELIA